MQKHRPFFCLARLCGWVARLRLVRWWGRNRCPLRSWERTGGDWSAGGDGTAARCGSRSGPVVTHPQRLSCGARHRSTPPAASTCASISKLLGTPQPVNSERNAWPRMTSAKPKRTTRSTSGQASICVCLRCSSSMTCEIDRPAVIAGFSYFSIPSISPTRCAPPDISHAKSTR